ncbi:MAG: hypothetical protein WC917_02640 [Bacilli bacterium]|jgi:hypothetical protein
MEKLKNGLVNFKKLLPRLEKLTAKEFGVKQSQVLAYWNGKTITLSINR